MIWLTNVKYLLLSLNTSWPLVFCIYIYIHVCTISKITTINEEKEIHLPNREYLSGDRWERMVVRCIVLMHINSELKAYWLLVSWCELHCLYIFMLYKCVITVTDENVAFLTNSSMQVELRSNTVGASPVCDMLHALLSRWFRKTLCCISSCPFKMWFHWVWYGIWQ